MPKHVGVVLVLPSLREQKHARHHQLHQRVGHEVLDSVVEHPREGLGVAEPVRDLAHHEGARVPRHHARRRLHAHGTVEVRPKKGTLLPFTHHCLRVGLIAQREANFPLVYALGGMGGLRPAAIRRVQAARDILDRFGPPVALSAPAASPRSLADLDREAARLAARVRELAPEADPLDARPADPDFLPLYDRGTTASPPAARQRKGRRAIHHGGPWFSVEPKTGLEPATC